MATSSQCEPVSAEEAREILRKGRGWPGMRVEGTLAFHEDIASLRWPKQARIRAGRLNLRGCTALSSLPEYLGPLAALNLRDCPNLRLLPDRLKISGWIDMAQSGLAELRTLPPSLKGVELRWQGV